MRWVRKEDVGRRDRNGERHMRRGREANKREKKRQTKLKGAQRQNEIGKRQVSEKNAEESEK